MNESRIEKGIKNAKVNFVFYFVMIAVTFFSRKIFLNTLGAEFIGLAGTLGNILSFLSLAELGVGTSMCYHLYKPIREEDTSKINELMSLFGWLYRIIGLVICAGAVVTSAFLPLILGHTGVNLGLAFFVYYSLLLSALTGYFINYRQLLLGADQKMYVVSAYLQTAGIVKTLVQMFLCTYFLNYWLWTIVELLFAVLACIVLNWRINRTYPWLKPRPRDGRRLHKLYPGVLGTAKQIFVHRLKDFLLGRSDQILVFAFVSLKYVAYYGNYSMLIMRLSSLFQQVLGSAEAGVGNLVAEGDRKKIHDVFYEFLSTRFLVAGVLCTVLFFVVPPFIEVWIGAEYLLGTWVILLMCVNLFINITRSVVDTFNHAYGHYADLWAAWTEGGLNLSVTVAVAWNYGLIGILLGKTVSLFLIIVIWKPIYLFRDGFKESVWPFWRNVGKYYVLLAVSIALTAWLATLFPYRVGSSWGAFFGFSAYIAFVMTVVYTSLMLLFTRGVKGFVIRLINHYRH